MKLFVIAGFGDVIIEKENVCAVVKDGASSDVMRITTDEDRFLYVV